MVLILCVIVLLRVLGMGAQDPYHQVGNGPSALTPGISEKVSSSLESRNALTRTDSATTDSVFAMDSNVPNHSNIRHEEGNGHDLHLLPTGSSSDNDSNENETRENPHTSTNDVTGTPNVEVGNIEEIHFSTESGGRSLEFIPFKDAENATTEPKDGFTRETLVDTDNTSTDIAVIPPVPGQNEDKEKENGVTASIPNTTTGNWTETERTTDIPITTTSYGRPSGDHERSINSSYHSLDAPMLRADHGAHSHLPRAESHKEDTKDQIAQVGNTTNLCLSCLCDPGKKNVYCKHEHDHDSMPHHMELHKGMIPKSATYLNIKGFDSVKIMRGAFDNEDLELRYIQFQDIKKVQFVRESLLFNAKARSNREVAVTFTNCGIEEIPTETFTQYARSEDQNNDIDLENTRFLTLEITRCNISNIRSYALTQARLLYFKMSHSKVGNMEEHSFHVDVYEDWVMEYNQLPKLVPHTICLRSQMLVIFSHNVFASIENRSMEITSSSQVLFEFNRVFYLGPEALMGITPKGRGSNLVFMNNTVVSLGPKSLLISNGYPTHERKILDNNFNVLCDCDVKKKFQPFLNINQLSSHQENLTFTNLIASSSCKRYEVSTIYNNIEEYVTNNCAPVPLPIIVSAAVVVAVVIITIIVCIVCTKRAEKAKEEANYLGECCYSHSFSTLNTGNPTTLSSPFTECTSLDRSKQMQPWVFAVPEVKTYQEAEVNVRYEHTDTLKASIKGSYQDPVIAIHQRAGVRGSCPFN